MTARVLTESDPDTIVLYDWPRPPLDGSRASIYWTRSANLKTIVYWPCPLPDTEWATLIENVLRDLGDDIDEQTQQVTMTRHLTKKRRSTLVYIYDRPLFDLLKDQREGHLPAAGGVGLPGPANPLVSPWSFLCVAQSPVLWIANQREAPHIEAVLTLCMLLAEETDVMPAVIKVDVPIGRDLGTSFAFRRPRPMDKDEANDVLMNLLWPRTPDQFLFSWKHYKPRPDLQWQRLPSVMEGLVGIREDAIDVLSSYVRDALEIFARSKQHKRPSPSSATAAGGGKRPSSVPTKTSMAYVVENAALGVSLPAPRECLIAARAALWDWYRCALEWTYPSVWALMPVDVPDDMLLPSIASPSAAISTSVLQETREKIKAAGLAASTSGIEKKEK
jgi:hypothetical protein